MNKFSKYHNGNLCLNFLSVRKHVSLGIFFPKLEGVYKYCNNLNRISNILLLIRITCRNHCIIFFSLLINKANYLFIKYGYYNIENSIFYSIIIIVFHLLICSFDCAHKIISFFLRLPYIVQRMGNYIISVIRESIKLKILR